MADQIEVSNVGGGKKDNVASDATLRELIKAIEKLDLQQGGSGNASKSLKDLANARKNNTAATNESTKSLGSFADEIENTTSIWKTVGGVTKAGLILPFKAAGAAISGLTNSAIGLTGELLSGGNTVSDFAKHIPLVGGALSSLTGYLDESYSAFQQLSMSGASFNNDLMALRQSAVDSRLSLDEYTAFVAGNASSLAAFGGSVTKGAQFINKMNNSLGATREQLLTMGFSFEDINEAMANYAVLNRAGARTEQQNAAQTAQYAASYAKSLQTLSKLTGEDVKGMKEKLAAQQMDIAFQMKLARLSPEERAKVQQGLADAMATAGEAGVELFKQQMLGMPPLTERTQMLVATMGEAATAVRGMASEATRSGVSLEQYNKDNASRMADTVEGLIAGASNMETILSATAAGLDGPGGEIGNILQSTGMDLTKYMTEVNGRIAFDRKAFEEDLANAKLEQAATDVTTQAMGSFQDTIAELRHTINTVMIKSGIFDAVSEGIVALTDAIDTDAVANFGKQITETIDSLVDKFDVFMLDLETSDFSTALDNLFNGMGDTFSLDGFGKTISDTINSLMSSSIAGINWTNVSIAVEKGLQVVWDKAKTMLFGGESDKNVNINSQIEQLQSQKVELAGGEMGTAGVEDQVAALDAQIAALNSQKDPVSEGPLSWLTNFEMSDALLAGGAVVLGLKALGLGLAGLGNGPAALGAAVFAGVAIGTGAAIMLAGKGVDLVGDGIFKIAAGMEQMSKIEGTENLKSVAGAMGMLGDGFLQLATGGVIESITSFFGADSPFEKMAKGVGLFESVNAVAVANIKTSAEGLSALTNITDKLDNSKLENYTESLENLTEVLKELNAELSKDNNGWSAGTGENAGSVLSKMNSIGGSGSGSSDQLDKLNNNITAVLSVLQQINTNTRKTVTATRGNSGDVYRGI